MMKKNVARILTAVLMLSVVFSSSVFAAEKEQSAWEAFVGLFANKAATTAEDTQVDGVTYRTHIQNEGWAQGWVSDGEMSGSEGKGLRLEGIEIKLDGTALPEGMGITYRTHIQNEGWAQGWVSDGQMSGSEGKGLRLEGIEIKLTGEQAANYSVQYRTHIENEGWAQGWVADGEMSGSEGKGLRLEGIEIKIVAVKADLTAYNAALAAVKEADYTSASWELYQTVVAANVVTEDNTQTEVDAATAAIVAAQGELVPVLKVVSVNAVNAEKLRVTFSAAIDAAEAKNFAIPGMTVAAATLQDNETEVVLQVAGAELGKDYVLTATGLLVDGQLQDAVTANFKMPNAESLYNTAINFTFSGGHSVLKSDGSDSCLVTFTLTDADGVVVENADDVEVAFTTTFGSFAEDRVTLQNGVATAMLISESLTSEKSALVRATVVESNQKALINLTATGNVTMTPVIDVTPDDKVGATLTDVVAGQADRVVLYFNKDVSVSKYTDALGNVDPAKATLVVREEANNDTTGGKAVNVVGFEAVPGNSKALFAIIDTADVLTDNANVAVDFSDLTGTAVTKSTKMTKLTDARRPAMLSVATEGLKTLKITFSEPIKNTNEADSATDLANWVIDGFRLDSINYGAAQAATATVGAFVPKTGEDTRNIVTITLGKDADGKQIYFKSGTHSIQGANIGDWANSTDVGNNVMNTQTLDFDIPVDENVPTATVAVQSPEQYIVSFDRQISESAADLQNLLVLQKYDATTATWVNVPVGAGVGNMTVQVSQIAGDLPTFKVETTQDWTQFYNTSGTNKNFYNDSYRLYIAKDSVTNVANGLKNATIQLALNGAITAPDVTSPVINEITQADPAVQVYTVTMSEPIKMPVGGDGLPTLAQTQTSVPQPTAEFIKKDNSETIPANTVVAVGNEFDTKVVVTPSKALTAGEWTLVVRSISDDVGNTAASATKDFTVQGDVPVELEYKVAFAVADTNYSDGFTVLQTARDTTTQDAVYVKFTKPVKVTGDQANVLKTANYTLNGSLLPTGTQIVANILNYDDKDTVVDSVTIVLPNGTLTDANTTVVTISNFLESADNEVIKNGGQKKLPFNFDTLITNGYIAAVEDVNTAFGNKATYDADDYKLFLAAIAKCNLALSGDSNVTVIQAETAKINAALELLGPSGDLPKATTSFYTSLTPGMKIVLVTLDTTTPENYEVSYDGIALTYDAAFGGFKAEISTTVSETLTPVVTKKEAPVMPSATTAFYTSLTPGMKIVLVTLDTTTPELYAVTYDGTALTYDAAFGGFKAEVSTTVSETLTPVVTLV
ncbi:hypothetical protein [Acetobacterium sp. MES1]|uniref:hypothetical protein n=1 Tax=Acetobacterium sp. MES1 TaxID=1899015 RepID=UPI00257E1451|nr:hypothetical protein [Acetobacterium sp. MES1]